MATNNIQTTHSRVSHTDGSFGNGCGICSHREQCKWREKVMSGTNSLVMVMEDFMPELEDK